MSDKEKTQENALKSVMDLFASFKKYETNDFEAQTIAMIFSSAICTYFDIEGKVENFRDETTGNLSQEAISLIVSSLNNNKGLLRSFEVLFNISFNVSWICPDMAEDIFSTYLFISTLSEVNDDHNLAGSFDSINAAGGVMFSSARFMVFVLKAVKLTFPEYVGPGVLAKILLREEGEEGPDLSFGIKKEVVSCDVSALKRMIHDISGASKLGILPGIKH